MPAALTMIAERPIVGWGPVEFQHELARRLGIRWGQKDAHNLYTHLLLEVGIVGAVPFLIGLFLCVRAAWQGRSGNLGLMPLACLMTILAANMFLTHLARKPLWLVLALALAAEPLASRRKGEHHRIVLARRFRRRVHEAIDPSL
jgi:O-antigen ligase